VTNLIAPTRTEEIRYLALARAAMVRSEPCGQSGTVARFLDAVTPA
jgi:hypothetical protein